MQERYLTQLRIVGKHALGGMYKVLSEEESEGFPNQNLTIGELICRFVEHQKEEVACKGESDPDLAGVMGGDGDAAYERLAFGFMVENSFHSIYRIWTRAWVVLQ